jgi:exodeoxyribonuclease VII small subunit
MTYKQAMTELERIVNNIESGDVDVDELSQSVTDAMGLIRTCREKLRKTDEAVKTALADTAKGSSDMADDFQRRSQDHGILSGTETDYDLEAWSSLSDADCPFVNEDGESPDEHEIRDPFADE